MEWNPMTTAATNPTKAADPYEGGAAATNIIQVSNWEVWGLAGLSVVHL